MAQKEKISMKDIQCITDYPNPHPSGKGEKDSTIAQKDSFVVNDNSSKNKGEDKQGIWTAERIIKKYHTNFDDVWCDIKNGNKKFYPASYVEEHYVRREKLEKRFDYWESSRGAYILSQKYRDELREFIFTGKSKGLKGEKD